MIIGSIPPTQYDLNFRLLGIPVRVHPLFWVFSLLLGANQAPLGALVWVGVVFVSIVVHEMGHALVVRQIGWWPSIVLYQFGGLAMYRPTHHDPRKQMIISLAGPFAGFLLATVVVFVLRATGHEVVTEFGRPFGLVVDVYWDKLDRTANFDREAMYYLAHFLLEVNVWWGIMNLLPVYPLDGGQFLAQLLDYLRVPDALAKSLWVSIFTACAVAIYALTRVHDYFLTAMFGYLAFTSLQTLQAITGRGGGYGRW